jgi:serine/threonine-protein kinase SRPK1
VKNNLFFIFVTVNSIQNRENVLVCVSDDYVKNIADEAADWQRLGIKPNASAISTAPASQLKQMHDKLNKNRKKKEKKKKKRQQAQIEKSLVSRFVFFL